MFLVGLEFLISGGLEGPDASDFVHCVAYQFVAVRDEGKLVIKHDVQTGAVVVVESILKVVESLEDDVDVVEVFSIQVDGGS